MKKKASAAAKENEESQDPTGAGKLVLPLSRCIYGNMPPPNPGVVGKYHLTDLRVLIILQPSRMASTERMATQGMQRREMTRLDLTQRERRRRTRRAKVCSFVH